MTPHIDNVALLPEYIVAGSLVVALIVDLFLGDERKQWVGAVSIFGAFASLLSVIFLAAANHHVTLFDGAYLVDDFALLAKGLMIAAGIAVLMLGLPSGWKGEYCLLILSSLLGMSLISSARELILFFVAFELLAIPGYLLVGWNKRATTSGEAALKYYLLGVIASAVMLYGLSLLYGLSGSTLFVDISKALSETSQQLDLARVAVLFVLVAMAFKVAAVPFHFWAPDAYQGAPIPVAAFLAIASKTAGVVATMVLVATVFPDTSEVWAPLLWGLAALTMTFGNVAALRQTDMVRLLAYSSIAQAGYALVPLAVATRYGSPLDESIRAAFEFLIIYAVMNVAAFSAVHIVATRSGSTKMSALRGLFYSSPATAIGLSVGLLSLAGIPPLGGWFAKLVIFRAAIDAGGAAAIVLLVIAAINAAIGLAYYALVIREMWTELDESSDAGDAAAESIDQAIGPNFVLAMATALVLLAGVLPGVVVHLGGFSSLTQ